MSNSAISGRMTGLNPVLIKNDYARALRSVLRNSAGLTTVAGLKTWQVLGFLLLHIPLALSMRGLPMVATVHAFGTLLLGLWCALFDRQRERVTYVVAYIVGSEVLWRMNESQSVWEFGKYATAAIFIAAMLRNGRFKVPLLPLIYFALLIPSIYLTAQGADFEKVRRQLSFNLSGAFALMVCCLFFSKQVFTTKQLHRLFLASIGPILGIAFLALGHAFTESSITFTRGSNAALSGGYGPNQVSSVLGLGGVLAFFLALASRIRPGVRILMLLCSAFLFAQSVVTFSRSGPYLGIGCVLLASFYLLRDRVSRKKLLIGVGVLAIAAVFVIPRLNAFTGGALAARYQEVSTTNRDLIALADLEMWLANPVFGVGPGGSYALHALTFRKQAAHTEYSRLLAEHGVFGLVAMILLLIIPLQNLRRARTPIGKALVAALAGWALLFMLVNAMRLVAPAFCIGLTCATFLSQERLSLAVKQRLANLLSRKGRGMAFPANRGA
jgi:O-Antigen ligase